MDNLVMLKMDPALFLYGWFAVLCVLTGILVVANWLSVRSFRRRQIEAQRWDELQRRALEWEIQRARERLNNKELPFIERQPAGESRLMEGGQ